MSLLGKSAQRSSQMMDALGVDVETSTMRGDVEPGEDQEIVLRCAACNEGDTCDKWLADPARLHKNAPDYCRNKALFDHLTP